ncbi:unnamed protein product [Prorocentrum cordatum]|uniref:Uncharacterized protein n=1 Tax=Prorocentrum cordatum TaxID=2364126 RepID=A0ABN9W4T5_9DINO|nr:unnamed protein product [Polarella glacialis]
MDDVVSEPDGVVELGRLVPSPDYRVPPRDEENELVTSVVGQDPQWNGDVGFDIVADVDDTGATIFPELKRLKSFCIAFSLNFPDSTPSQELSCTECVTEADCGNYNADEVWCQSPIAANCLAPDETVLTDGFEAFTFKLRPQVDSPITARTVVRIFLRPLTQWNIAATCFVAFDGGACPAPATGGVCGNPACQSEAVAGGTPEIPHDLPFNTLRITLPDVMGDITSASGGVFMKVGSLSLPPGGFFPQGFSAELESETGAPDDWQPTSDNVKVYKTPKIVAASLVTADDPLVNTKPFRGDTDNKLYVRLVSGANLFANQQGDVKLTVISPFGYACATTDTFGGTVPDGLTVFDDKVPNTKGRFGGDSTKEELQFSNSLDPIGCAVTFKASMILYAMSVVYFEMSVDNPPTALQQNDESNVWSLRTEVTDGITYTLDDYPLSGQTYAACASPQEKLYCIYDMGSDFGGSVSVLGLLSDVILQPFNFGASALNEMFVFFTTAQTVGTLDAMESEVWVDAPSTFDFGQYCSASHLPESYYIPEGKGTTPLPTGDVINCLGSLAASGELTYNRAKIKTTGRLLATTPYGFSVKVTNAPYYVLTQLTEWRIWTYTQSGVAVDGAYETARFNQMEDAGSDSWGIYQLSMPSANFGVTISDLRPSMDRAATDIIVFPIVVQTAMDLHVRILAPAEYIWDFQQDEFKYKAAGFGVASNLVVEGAEADLPINYGPNAPQTAPFNRITLDSIQTAWTPGVKYGFAAKIRLPRYPPTGSANYFCIEFGFDETYDANRLEAGVTEGPQIQTLINGGVSFTTSITSANTTITFSVQTITSIPVGGGIVIVGPPNFKFEYPLCSPKPAEGFPEMPYDSTCLFTEIVSTGQPKVSIVAGASGIPPGYYRFSLDATNPPIVRSQDEAGEWVIQTYSLVSEGTLLDYDTTIASFPIGDTMLYADLIMHTRAQELENQPCIFLTQAEQAIDSQRPVSTCDFEYWQFYSPQGYRDDRPGVPSQLIIAFKLSSTPVGTTSEIVVRAPEGYEFDIECDVVVDSTRIFDDSATTDLGQDSVSDTENLGYTEDENTFESRFAIWPATASVASCSGDANVARIIIAYGLESGEVTTDNPNPLPYVFRLGVVANPTSTPSYNKFVLEVNSATSTEFSAESSVPFDGVDIWSFKDVSIVQSTTAASTQALTIMNTVTITFRPVNSLPNGGHMRVLAPSSFAIPTVCDVGVELDAADMPVMESEVNQVLALKYSEFRDGDVLCQGDSTPSSRAKLVFVTDVASGKYLKGGLMYHVTLTVQNPQTTADVPEYWSLYSYEDTTTNSLIDSASFPGFTINAAVHAFDYVSPSSTNAHAVQVVTFSISFPSVVDFGESVRVVAPVSFYFGTIGDAICPQYAHLSGSLALTVPVCAANTITWTLEQETVPAYSPSTFLVQLRNPGTTPQTNMFQVRHLAADGSRKSSRIVSGFSIVPELVALAVSPTPLGSQWEAHPAQLDTFGLAHKACRHLAKEYVRNVTDQLVRA